MAHKLVLPFRQIHLDFHTSEHIPLVGACFEAEAFAATLADAHVDSVTCFARCHHGWLYYDSQRFPERVHPQLMNKDLLKEQIEACHARGIRVPIYITVQWDYYTAQQHPEWLQLEDDGRIAGNRPFEPGFYQCLLVNSPYLEFLKAQTQEVLTTLPVDGLFFDIVRPLDDSSRWTREQMQAEGLDSSDKDARMAFGVRVINAFKQEMTAFVHTLNPDCSVFYNGGHIGPRHRAVKDAYTHFEIESLPSTSYWGYLHFPLAVRYGRTLGLDSVSMTGKFHTSWGDFHSYKNEAALEYEVFRMLALGSKCMVGDQLHPNGTLDVATYDLIGKVYAEVARKEPWCDHVTPLCDLGVLAPEAFSPPSTKANIGAAIEGLTLMLEESGLQFDVLDAEADFSSYKVLILPDEIPVGDALAEKLAAFSAQGGALIASFASAMNAERDAFTLPQLGVELLSAGNADGRGQIFDDGNFCDYLKPGRLLGGSLVDTEYVMYTRGMPVRPRAGADILADGYTSYFDRTFEHFCSHRQTPSSGKTGTPAVVQQENAIYFAHPIFTQYRHNAPRWCKQLFLNALARVLPTPLIQHDSVSTLRLSVNDQPGNNRYVLHLLHYIPERRGERFDTLEDVIPVHDIGLRLTLPRAVERVRLVPGGEDLPFQRESSALELRVPKLVGHQMLELAYTS